MNTSWKSILSYWPLLIILLIMIILFVNFQFNSSPQDIMNNLTNSINSNDEIHLRILDVTYRGGKDFPEEKLDWTGIIKINIPESYIGLNLNDGIEINYTITSVIWSKTTESRKLSSFTIRNDENGKSIIAALLLDKESALLIVSGMNNGKFGSHTFNCAYLNDKGRSELRSEKERFNKLDFASFYSLLGYPRSDIKEIFGKHTREEFIDGRIVYIHDIEPNVFYGLNYRNDRVLNCSLVMDVFDKSEGQKVIEPIAKKLYKEGYRETDYSKEISTVTKGNISIRFQSVPLSNSVRIIIMAYLIDPTVLGAGWSQGDFGNEYNKKLYYAIEDDDVEVVKQYIDQGWELESKNGALDQTIFSSACAVGAIKVVKYLISMGSDINYINPHSKFSTLMEALPVDGAPSEYNEKKNEVFIYLLNHPNVDIFYEYSPGKNILDYAKSCALNNKNLIKQIAEKLESRNNIPMLK